MTARWRSHIVFAAVLSICAAGALIAQDQGGDPNQGNAPNGDPPARVARIQYISGQVSMQPGGVNDWVAASMNRPLTTSDRVWTDKDSRVELNLGSGFIRLNSESSLTLTNVGDNAVQLQLDQGTLEITVRHLEPGEVFEVDTPNLAFTVMKSGVYRIDVPPNDNQTWVTARKGYGEATGQGPAVKVSSGEQVRFTGQGSLQHVAYAAPAPDGFDDWASVRDKRLDGTQSARYVAPGVIGYEDLDYYGTWRVVPTYGAIWVPTSVAVGWAPYRNGHWVWINPWGWTWVDDAPWGFAPFHYGRWVHYGGAWGWAPGPAYVGWRPYYAPALVAWVGGAGWGVSVSFGGGWGGGCGWFPLGWGEPYYPWYHGHRGGYVSNTYIRNVNVTNTRITNITNITNNYYRNVNNTHYVNRNIDGAVTAAPKSALINGQNIARVGTTVPRSELGRGEVLRTADVAPTRQSMLGGRTPVNSAIPPRRSADRSVAAQNQSPAPSAAATSQMRTGAQAPARRAIHNSNADNVNQARNVPRPPDRMAAANAPATSTYQYQGGAQRVVPRPPSAPGMTSGTTPSNEHSYPATSQAMRNPTQSPQSSRAQSPAPATRPVQPSHGSQGNTPKEAGRANPGMAYSSSSVARPPEGYRYQSSSGYSASPSAGGGSYSAGNRGYTPPTATYQPNRGYTPPAATGRYSGGYTSPQTYNARPAASPAPHYSAPSYSGGNSGRPSGGGASHASSPASHGGHTR